MRTAILINSRIEGLKSQAEIQYTSKEQSVTLTGLNERSSTDGQDRVNSLRGIAELEHQLAEAQAVIRELIGANRSTTTGGQATGNAICAARAD